jgi:hypothetical protein
MSRHSIDINLYILWRILLKNNTQFSEVMKSLVGVEDCDRIQQVGKWISGKDSYLWRFNSKPSKSVERALVLVDYNARFYIVAGVDVDDGRRARGFVARVAENP